jgi:hypothetical protein
MPILQYLFGVGGALLCLMFALNAYVPAAPPREQHEIDKSIIHVTAAPTGDFVIDHFPAVRGDLADAANDAVKKAMAMMPPQDIKQAAANTEHPAAAVPRAPHKRRVAQRPQSQFASGDAPSPMRSQASSNSGWSNNGWSSSWSNNSGNWSHGWGDNHWADNR